MLIVDGKCTFQKPNDHNLERQDLYIAGSGMSKETVAEEYFFWKDQMIYAAKGIVKKGWHYAMGRTRECDDMILEDESWGEDYGDYVRVSDEIENLPKDLVEGMVDEIKKTLPTEGEAGRVETIIKWIPYESLWTSLDENMCTVRCTIGVKTRLSARQIYWWRHSIPIKRRIMYDWDRSKIRRYLMNTCIVFHMKRIKSRIKSIANRRR